jgi:hypothetical protein
MKKKIYLKKSTFIVLLASIEEKVLRILGYIKPKSNNFAANVFWLGIFRSNLNLIAENNKSM